MIYEFDAAIQRLEGKIQWLVLYFPESAEACFGTKGNIPVRITADGHAFDHTLLPSKNGHYLVYNEFLRRAVGKAMGESVHVTLEKDDRPRAFVCPENLAARLREAGAWDMFARQPEYLKREQANRIALAKKEETRANRVEKLIALLKK